MKKLLIVALFAMTAVAHAQNQYFVAATGGSDSNAGTSAGSPWATCNHAVATAALNSVGATINFIASSSQHAACSNIARNVVSPARMVLQCTAQVTAGTHCKMAGAFIIRAANNIDIGALPRFSFEYTNPSDNTAVDVVSQCASGAGACAFGNGIHVIGNYFHDIAQSNGTGCPSSGAILITNAHGVSVTDAQVIGNVVDHIGIFPGPPGNQMQGIYVSTKNGQVYNNVVTRACYSGLQYYDEACNGRVSNNVFANNTAGMVYYGGNGCTPGNNTASNNIIVNNTGFAVNNSFSGDSGSSPGHPTLYTNNIIFGNPSGTFTSPIGANTQVVNQRSENPTTTFVNYTGTASGDYHLKAGSIAIAGGVSTCVSGGSTPCVSSVDQAGASRPPSGTQDMGVFVFSSGAVPIVSLTPSPLAFGAIAVSSSSTLTATLANTGTANLTFSAATISGTNAADYSIVSTTCASSLTAGSSCTYSLKFTPAATGARSASLTLNDNASGSPHQLPMTGTGGTGIGVLSPDPASFGVVAPGSCSAAQSIILTNTGSVAFNQNASSSITPSQVDFQFASPIGSCINGPLAAGASCTTNVKFCPSGSGAKTATFNAFTDANDPSSTLNGTGGAAIATVAPTSASCGSVQVGSSSTCQVFTLTNTGNINLTGITVSIP